jgi:hypothetical protein
MRPAKKSKEEKELRSQMHSVESLLRSHHSVGSESATEKEQAEGTDEEKE